MTKSEMLSQGPCLLTRHILRLTTIQSNIYISHILRTKSQCFLTTTEKRTSCFRSLPFCAVTQRMLVVTDVSGQPIGPIFKVLEP